jgi:hypothetical protein
MPERRSPDSGPAVSQEFLPIASSGVEDLRRQRASGVRWLATAALTLGLSATAACSPDIAGPVAPSPGTVTIPAPTRPAPTTPVSTTPPGQTAPITPGPGPGATRPGINMVVVPRPDGSFDITEDVVLPQATNILHLQLPSSGEQLPGMMSRTSPKATGLRLFAHGQTVPLATNEVTHPTDVPLTRAATRLRLTYRLSGSTVRRTPAKPERAASAIRPLTATSNGVLPTDLTISGGELLNAVCPLMPQPLCAVGDPPKLSVLQGIPADKALVVLQLDLPQPQ